MIGSTRAEKPSVPVMREPEAPGKRSLDDRFNPAEQLEHNRSRAPHDHTPAAQPQRPEVARLTAPERVLRVRGGRAGEAAPAVSPREQHLGHLAERGPRRREPQDEVVVLRPRRVGYRRRRRAPGGAARTWDEESGTRRRGPAAATATAALAVRQNYIVWFGFAALLLAIEVARSPVMTVVGGRIVANARALLSRATAADLVARAAGYIVGLGLFAAFLAWNRGIAVGDREMHPFPTVQFGNIYFALFLVFFFFLPLHLKNARQISQLLVRPVTILTLAGLLLFFLVTFRTEHPYNQPALRWWLHNALLASLTSSVWAKLAMFGAMAVALLSLRVTPLRESSHYLVYPFAVISLLPAWQIEQRYYIAPLVLFLLFRVQTSPSLEWLLIAYLAAFTGILFLGIANGAYFL